MSYRAENHNLATLLELGMGLPNNSKRDKYEEHGVSSRLDLSLEITLCVCVTDGHLVMSECCQMLRVSGDSDLNVKAFVWPLLTVIAVCSSNQELVLILYTCLGGKKERKKVYNSCHSSTCMWTVFEGKCSISFKDIEL